MAGAAGQLGNLSPKRKDLPLGGWVGARAGVRGAWGARPAPSRSWSSKEVARRELPELTDGVGVAWGRREGALSWDPGGREDLCGASLRRMGVRSASPDPGGRPRELGKGRDGPLPSVGTPRW